MKRAIVSTVLALSMGLCSLSVSAAEERTAARTDSADSNARRVAYLVNNERTAQGLGALIYSPELSQAAQVRAEEIRVSFSHTRPDGRSCFTALDEAGISYRSAGENIAIGQRSPEEVMKAWMNSSGHRANILSERYQYIGVGAVCGRSCSWSQFFAASNSLTGEVLTDEPAPEKTEAPVVTVIPEEEKEPAVTIAPEEEKLPEVTAAPEKEQAPEITTVLERCAAPDLDKAPCLTQRDCGKSDCQNVNSLLEKLLGSVCAKGTCSKARLLTQAFRAFGCNK